MCGIYCRRKQKKPVQKHPRFGQEIKNRPAREKIAVLRRREKKGGTEIQETDKQATVLYIAKPINGDEVAHWDANQASDGFESRISHNNHDELQDHCVIM